MCGKYTSFVDDREVRRTLMLHEYGGSLESSSGDYSGNHYGDMDSFVDS